MAIQRDLLQNIKPYINGKEVISISGPRQSGKTTFLEILSDYLSKELDTDSDSIKVVSFEDGNILTQFNKDPISFIRSYTPQQSSNQRFYFMIDEFQYAPDGGQKLRLIYDTIKNIKIVITASTSLEIKAKVSKSMGEDILNFYLYPFSFGEYLRATNKNLEDIYLQCNRQIVKWIEGQQEVGIESGEDLFCDQMAKEYEKFCIWGGYPQVVLAKTDEERKKLLSSIYNEYILKDIKIFLGLPTENNLFLLSQYLATHIANIIFYQDLIQPSGLKYRRLKRHLSILEETFICKELKPFFKNKQKELSKNPKIFFLDLGFRNNLMDNASVLDKRSDAEAMIENAVFIKLNELCKVNFWRTKVGAEVDFVLDARNGITPVELKYAKFSSGKISKSLASFIDYIKPDYAMVLTKNYWGSIKRNKTEVLFIPLYYL